MGGRVGPGKGSGPARGGFLGRGKKRKREEGLGRAENELGKTEKVWHFLEKKQTHSIKIRIQGIQIQTEQQTIKLCKDSMNA